MSWNTIERIRRNDTGRNQIHVTSDKVFSYGIHAHEYYEMTIYIPEREPKKAAKVTLNGTEITIKSLTAILVTPSDIHKIESEEESATFIKVAFDGDILQMQGTTIPNSFIVLKNIPEKGLVHLLFEEMLSLSLSKQLPEFYPFHHNICQLVSQEQWASLSQHTYVNFDLCMHQNFCWMPKKV